MDRNEAIEYELEAVKAIFPELEVSTDNTKCRIKLPVRLESAIDVELYSSKDDGKVLKQTQIKNLPPLEFTIELPPNYPNHEAPKVSLKNVTPWITEETAGSIYNQLQEFWESFQDCIIFTYIDYIKTNSETGFGLFSEKGNKLIVHEEADYAYLIAENSKAQLVIFDSLTFTCDICQAEHEGFNSTEFPDCGHVFCNPCLNDYFTHIIERGETENIHCPSFQCTQRQSKYVESLSKQAETNNIKDFKKFDIEFFQLPVSVDLLKRFLIGGDSERLIQRYQTLYFRSTMNRYRRYFPNRVSECPRTLCSTTFIKADPDSKLSICPTCNFAFCGDCFHSWHGEINSCSMYMKKIPTEILAAWLDHNGDNPNKQSAEDREFCTNISFKYGKKIIELAVSDYVAQEQFEELIRSGEAEIVKCPNCCTYIQRSDGCNKMTCSKCLVFFCNLCGDRLNRNDPYEHYNNPMNSCFGKLFLGMVANEDVADN